ncbi:MAG: hypothetical protein ACE366_21345 [Bradymonadia bacterium]
MRGDFWLVVGIALMACDPADPGGPSADGWAMSPIEDAMLADAELDFDLGAVDADAPDASEVDAFFTDLDVPDIDVSDAEPDIEPPAVERIELGPCALGVPVTFEVPDGFESALIQARGRSDGVYLIADVAGPSGALEGAAATAPQPEIATALMPNDGTGMPLEPGAYTFVLEAVGPVEGGLSCEVWLKGPPGATVTAINLLLPPGAEVAPGDAALEQMAQALEGHLEAQFDIQAEISITSLAAGSPTVLDLGPTGAELVALGELGAGAIGLDVPEGIDVYLVDQIQVGALTQSGISGGLPVPIGHRGRASSVVAVRTSLIEDFPADVAWRVAHEIGHALGLYHTTEARLIPGRDPVHDPIEDTLECPEICDVDNDRVLFATECGVRGQGVLPCEGTADNLMFWSPAGLKLITDGQREVIQRHPLVGGIFEDFR